MNNGSSPSCDKVGDSPGPCAHVPTSTYSRVQRHAKTDVCWTVMKRQGEGLWESWPTMAAISRCALLLPSRAPDKPSFCASALAARQRGDGELGVRPLLLGSPCPGSSTHSPSARSQQLPFAAGMAHPPQAVRGQETHGVTESDRAESATPALPSPKLRGAQSYLPACGGAHEN